MFLMNVDESTSNKEKERSGVRSLTGSLPLSHVSIVTRTIIDDKQVRSVPDSSAMDCPSLGRVNGEDHRRRNDGGRHQTTIRLGWQFTVVLLHAVLFSRPCSATNKIPKDDFYALYDYCPSFCTESNNYQSGFYCTNSRLPYCCGNLNNRYCCANSSLSIDDDYNDVCYACSSTPCGFFNEWSTILMSMAIVLCTGMFVACCCHCYATSRSFYGGSCCPKNCRFWFSKTSPSSERENAAQSAADTRHNRRARRHHHRRNHHTETVVMPGETSDFNPDHPFAFHPPDYDQLSTTNSEPPKYDDIATVNNGVIAQGGETNAAYENDESPPPGLRVSPVSVTVSVEDQSLVAATGSSATGSSGGDVVAVDVSSTTPEGDNVSLPPEYEVAVTSSVTAPDGVV